MVQHESSLRHALLLLAALTVQCTPTPTTACEATSLASGGTMYTVTACSDHRQRKVACEVVQPPSGPATGHTNYRCVCSVSGAAGRTFPMDDTTALSTAQTFASVANPQCGWSLTLH